MNKPGFIYILASRPRGTLYVGVTSDLVRRVHQHRTGETGGFTERYGVKCLVYYERANDIEAAIGREKKLKRWRRAWKLRLIESANPEWRDLWDEIVGDRSGGASGNYD